MTNHPLIDVIRELDAMIETGEPRYALTSRMGQPFAWEQVGGRKPTTKHLINLFRVRLSVACKLDAMRAEKQSVGVNA